MSRINLGDSHDKSAREILIESHGGDSEISIGEQFDESKTKLEIKDIDSDLSSTKMPNERKILVDEIATRNKANKEVNFNKASLQFDPSGLVSADGLSSEDAVKLATGIVKDGPQGYSAPAQASSAASLVGIRNVRAERWHSKQLKELRDSPARIIIGVSVLLVAALVLWIIKA